MKTLRKLTYLRDSSTIRVSVSRTFHSHLKESLLSTRKAIEEDISPVGSLMRKDNLFLLNLLKDQYTGFILNSITKMPKYSVAKGMPILRQDLRDDEAEAVTSAE